MKSRSLLMCMCAVLAALSLAASGCAQRTIAHIDSKGSTIVCFGDSLTYGYGVEPGEDYPSVMGKLAGVPVVNAGVTSETSLDGLARIEKDVLAHQPMLVIVAFGGNDFLNQVPKEKTRQAMCAIIDKIHQAGSMVAVVDVSAGFLFQEYQPFLRSIAREKEAFFIPNVFYNVVNNPSLKSDFVHPNAQGYAVVAQRVYAAIKPYLEKNRLSRVSAPAPAP